MSDETQSSREEDGQRLVDLGASMSRTGRGNIYTLTIIGQIEGHNTLPENTKTITEAENCDIAINQVIIGSCTNGRLEDLKAAAEILQGRHVAKTCRTIVIPATQQIYLDALKAGYLTIFVEAGCSVSTPTCGPCLGGHMGILAAGERALATTNRNFVGRMGHPSSEVYLCSPAVAAASAITGKITSPAHV